MVRILLLIIFLGNTAFSFSQGMVPDPSYKLMIGVNFIQSKNYYLLTLLQQDKNAHQLLTSDAALSTITKNKLGSLSLGLKSCSANAGCFTELMKFSEQEIKDVSSRLTFLYKDGNALGNVISQLRASGTYLQFKNASGAELLVKAWEQDAHGINHSIGVYGEGKKANYPLIDSISFNIRDPRYFNTVYTTAYAVTSECKNTKLFFVPSLTSALRFLEINERDNAGDYEPMISTVNKPAFDKIKSTRFNDYKYTLILVPGAGPDNPSVALSAEAMLRCRISAVQYEQHLAPFIVVSGGKVHPYKTKFNEAMEMKNFLIKKCNIPESAVIVEPHARHTTTNMRNTARLIFRYGMPFQKPCLTSTSRGQSFMIATTLAERCKKELMEIPFRNGARLSETEMEFYPLIEALRINPFEPMDP